VKVSKLLNFCKFPKFHQAAAWATKRIMVRGKVQMSIGGSEMGIMVGVKSDRSICVLVIVRVARSPAQQTGGPEANWR
jgi:hypothetical protein